MTTGILGGGLVGLVIGSQLGDQCEILEADHVVGGHCRSLMREGYTFDVGGPHIMFSRDEKILRYMIDRLDGNVVRPRRNVKIIYRDKYVKYPFENGLFDLDPQDRFECLNGFICNDYPREGNTFRDWIYRTFGTGIAEKYLLPYNEKIWNVPAEQMSDDWVEGRVPKPTVEEIIKSAVGVETEGYTHQLYFNYPRRGGIESLAKAFARDCRAVTTNFRVRRVWREGASWCVSDGASTRRYARLVSTIAIQDLLAALPDVPCAVVDAVKRLRFNSLRVVMFGVKTEAPNPFTAFYVPDPRYPFHRISFPLNFSPESAPEGHEAIAVEITTNPGDGLHDMPDGKLAELVLSGLEDLRLVRPGTVRFQSVHNTQLAYVIRTSDYERNLKTGLDYLNGLGIISSGRNAEFAYINMDEAIRRGLAVAESLQA